MVIWSARVVLQNRVTPFGELFAIPSHGTLMGNRGGKIHRDDKTLGSRRWVSRQWICCVLKFKNRQRDIWGPYYTELFFLDETTAFAAGHRPCFECRRKDAERFATLFSGKNKRASAGSMDKVLHAERLNGKIKRTHRRKLDTLPDGAMIVRNGDAFAVRGKEILPWTPAGYSEAKSRPSGIDVEVLTPPSILTVLASGYTPLWHPSAA
jgi:hypothetical protein